MLVSLVSMSDQKCHKSNGDDLEMIPKSDELVRSWCQFEGASTYEYAHGQVREGWARKAK